MKKAKKGQTEIFGLVVIILLISVAMLFVITFLIKKEPSTLKKEFQQEEIGANWLNAFLKTTAAECNGADMTDLIIDCAENHETPLITCNSGVDTSCNYLYDKSQYLLGVSLDTWGYTKYNLYMEKKPNYPGLIDDKYIINKVEHCSRNTEKRVSPYIIPVSAGQVNVKLEICS